MFVLIFGRFAACGLFERCFQLLLHFCLFSSSSDPSSSKCYSCGFVVNITSELYFSVNSVHYHKDCFKCKR